jgi:hypothetical protein
MLSGKADGAYGKRYTSGIPSRERVRRVPYKQSIDSLSIELTMNSSIHPLRLAALAALTLSFTAAQAGSFILVTERTSLGANDSLDWNTTGLVDTSSSSPLAATSIGGLGVSASISSGDFQRFVQGNNTWNGGFGPSDLVLYSASGPITFTLPAPIAGAGLNIESAFGGSYTAQIEAFSGATSLGGFTVDGVAHFTAETTPFTAPFIGFLSDSANVTSFTVSLAAANVTTDRFAVNQVSFVTAVPEPTEYAAMAGFALAAFAVRRGIKK